MKAKAVEKAKAEKALAENTRAFQAKVEKRAKAASDAVANGTASDASNASNASDASTASAAADQDASEPANVTRPKTSREQAYEARLAEGGPEKPCVDRTGRAVWCSDSTASTASKASKVLAEHAAHADIANETRVAEGWATAAKGLAADADTADADTAGDDDQANGDDPFRDPVGSVHAAHAAHAATHAAKADKAIKAHDEAHANANDANDWRIDSLRDRNAHNALNAHTSSGWATNATAEGG